MPSQASRLRRVWSAFGVAAALVLYWFMAASVSPRMGVTADEVVHLTGGYTYWKFNDYRLHPENGTLPMRIAALPTLGMGLKFPPLDNELWRTSKVNLVGEQFFYELGNPLDRMLARARMMIALVGAFAVWLTWRWAHGLFGPAAGWVALVLALFCPAMLAHGGLATSDITMTACVLAALSSVWLVLHRVTWLRVIVAALVCGLAFLSKMSGVLIVPLIAGMVVIRWLRPVPLVWALGRLRWLRRRAQIVVATTGLTLSIAVGSLVVLWGAYGFRYDAFNRSLPGAPEFYLSWDQILDKQPLPDNNPSALAKLITTQHPHEESGMSRLIAVLRDHHLLPESYLWGFAHTYKFARYRPAFLQGEHRATGWKTFFPIAFALKTTLPALALIGTGAAALCWAAGQRSREKRGAVANPAPGRAWLLKPWLYRATPLLLFFVVYWAMAIQMRLNIGHRHILPTYPIFYVFASASVLWLATRPRRLVVAGLGIFLAVHAADSLQTRPFYLSYFQPLAGGIERGYQHLVDSSYDWGQGLPELGRWLEAKKSRQDPLPVYLTYFGADSPKARGLDVVRFADEITDSGVRVFPALLRPGYYVMSATHFQRAYLPVRGPWQQTHEQLYRELIQRLQSARDAALRTPEENQRLLQDAKDYEILCFARMSYLLQHRRPLEIVGGSLLVFKLSAHELGFALNAPLAELQRAAEAAAN